jgi:polar amino acid transport system permease protein
VIDAFEIVRRNLPLLGEAFWVTIKLNLVSIALALVLGTGMGVARHYGGRVVYAVLGVVVDIVRSIPILVLLVWMFFALPVLVRVPAFSAFWAAVCALGIHTGVYIAEIVRGGLASVRSGQMLAGTALGMSWWQAVVRVILPQAMIRMLPPIGSRVVRNIKESVLASTIACQELFWAANLLEGETAKPFPIYTTLMIFYFVMIVLVARGIDRLYARIAVRGRA